MRLIDADKLYPDRMTKDGLAISQSQIANAPTVEINTNDIEYKAYCRGLDDGMLMGSYSASPHGVWVQCSDRLPTADDGERVIVHICFEKPTCEYVYIPWKTVGFEYQVGHIDAWLAIPKYEKEVRE